ncbi:MAG: hypothetical protein ACM3NT_02235 [Methylocystaceae bacterium]
MVAVVLASLGLIELVAGAIVHNGVSYSSRELHPTGKIKMISKILKMQTWGFIMLRLNKLKGKLTLSIIILVILCSHLGVIGESSGQEHHHLTAVVRQSKIRQFKLRLACNSALTDDMPVLKPSRLNRVVDKKPKVVFMTPRLYQSSFLIGEFGIVG